MNLMPPQTVSRAGDVVDAMVGVKQYAELHHAGERTVRTWLADGRLHSAVKHGNVWMIDPNDEPAEPQAGAGLELVPQLPQAVQHVPHGATLDAELASSPAFLELEQASRLLGIGVAAIRRHRDYFELVPFGPNGSLVMPAAVVRRVAGV